MDILEAKEEFTRRYCYLFFNSLYLYGPVYFGLKRRKDKQFQERFLGSLEELTLSDKPFLENEGYEAIEKLFRDSDLFRKMSLHGAEDNEIKGKNRDYAIQLILFRLYDYIEMQNVDLDNRDRKLQVIDEYIRISRYQNDGKIWTSGRKHNLKDIINNCSIFSDSIPPRPKPNRNEVGVSNNEFINIFSDIQNKPKEKPSTAIHFTEKEKQSIFLRFHDVIPWDLQVKCQSSKVNNSHDQSNCGKMIDKIEESKIFFLTDDEYTFTFHYLCPYCGSVVDLDSKLLSSSVRERIITKNFTSKQFGEEKNIQKVLKPIN